MQENNYHKNIFSFFQTLIYFLVLLDIYIQCLTSYFTAPWQLRINEALGRLPLFTNPLYSHVIVFMVIFLVAAATKAQKEIEYKAAKHFFYPFFIGLLLYAASILVLGIKSSIPHANEALYGFTYIIGAMFLHVSLGNISKKIFSAVGKDRWNIEQESFAQNTKLVQTSTSFNLPIQFYYKRNVNNGWMNINPFRGVMVIGTPGSGKTESVIIPFIKQFLKKGFSMLVYDFKYPDLGEIAYYHYLLNHVNNGPLKDHNFHVINLDSIEHSRRINPLHPRYVRTLADATETAETLIYALMKTEKSSGSSQFFTQSAINFLAACIYYFATFDSGRYSTLPHVLAFISQPYENIFNTLFSNLELHPLLAPFKSAWDNKAFDQLEGQIGTVRVNVSRIATKEAFWVFSAEDFNLKLSNPKSILVIANSPDTQGINSAFYSVVLNRITKLVNTKGNNPMALVVDETPTLFLHKIENLIATARSNKVAVLLGLQELPQFHQQYGKEVASTITSIMGSIISGAVRNKETLDWLERLFGKVKQTSQGLSISQERTNININERLDSLIPASKIANLNAGELVGIVSRESSASYGEFQPNVYNCRIAIDMPAVEGEKKLYKKLPEFYNFGGIDQKNRFLLQNMQKIYSDVESILL